MNQRNSQCATDGHTVPHIVVPPLGCREHQHAISVCFRPSVTVTQGRVQTGVFWPLTPGHVAKFVPCSVAEVGGVGAVKVLQAQLTGTHLTGSNMGRDTGYADWSVVVFLGPYNQML
jgi:hypothetical protein